jgi:hypothetical protein
MVYPHFTLPLLAFMACNTPSSEPMKTRLRLVDKHGDALMRPREENVHLTVPVTASSAYSFLSKDPTNTVVSLTAGEDCTLPPVMTDHNRVPVVLLNACTNLSSLPTYTTPLESTTGDDKKKPLVGDMYDQCDAPEATSKHTKLPFFDPINTRPSALSAGVASTSPATLTDHRRAPDVTLIATNNRELVP